MCKMCHQRFADWLLYKVHLFAVVQWFQKKKLQIRLPPRHHSLEEMGLHPTYLFKGYLESVIGPLRN